MTPRTAALAATLLTLALPAPAHALDITFGDLLEYDPPTATITQGESVTWRGNFAEHPLSSASGAFADRDTGGRYTVNVRPAGELHLLLRAALRRHAGDGRQADRHAEGDGHPREE